MANIRIISRDYPTLKSHKVAQMVTIHTVGCVAPELRAEGSAAFAASHKQVPIPAPSEVAGGHHTGCEVGRVPSGGDPGITQPEGRRAAGTPVLPRTVQVRPAAAERAGARCLHRWQRRPRRRRHAKAAQRLGTAVRPPWRCRPAQAPPGPNARRAPWEALEWVHRPAGSGPQRRPLPPPRPGARFLPLPARPPPGSQPTACPRGRQEATCPRKECRARGAGGGRWAGPGGPGRELPAGKAGESGRAGPLLPRPQRTLARDGAATGQGAARPGPGSPPLPHRAPLAPPARRRGQAVTFPHTPPSRRRRLWGPGGEQGAD
ncbi:hypothetical protein H8959_003394 [Pygathrix nigripes]